MSWLDELAQNYSIATVKSIGRSVEGRELKLIKVSTSSDPRENKSAIFIDGNFHAREASLFIIIIIVILVGDDVLFTKNF